MKRKNAANAVKTSPDILKKKLLAIPPTNAGKRAVPVMFMITDCCVESSIESSVESSYRDEK